MPEPRMDTAARALARIRDRRSLLGVLAGVLVGGSVWPRPTRADDRDRCREKRGQCADRALNRCRERFRYRRAPGGLPYPSTTETECRQETTACCRRYDWNPDRDGDGGECSDDREIETCVEAVFERLEVPPGPIREPLFPGL